MPPVGRSAGLMLVLSGCVCLAAQAVSPAATPQNPGGTDGSQDDRGSLAEESRRLRYAITSQPGKAGPHPQSEEPRSVPLFTKGADTRIRLTPRRRPTRTADTAMTSRRSGTLQSMITVASSLAVVLGLFLVVAWAMRRAVPGASAALPSEVVEVLGRSVLAGREQLHLLRCGNKLLLVSVGQTGVETLTEITDPDEVNRLAGLCRQGQPGSATAAFRQVFEQLAGKQTAPGLPGTRGEEVRRANPGIPGTKSAAWEGHDV